MYDMVVGFEGRIKWRREMEAVRAEIRKIDTDYFSSDEPKQVQNAEM